MKHEPNNETKIQKIDVEDAIRLLDNCQAISLEDGVLIYPSLRDDMGESFLVLHDEEHDETYYFDESCNPMIINERWLCLTDREGERCRLTLLEKMKLVV